ncbi:hypothetical protein [Niveispirillum sp. BGYR6]|uniref:hypothetical protein n=1 Tax=Niveispirillum sp. BGYR6 TaxID=2971249 RepID=UPI0022B94BF0|nr:hypothetical protein [Niveispirillum sp. BGYR6]MDG5494484.1 hypothetical protein [Niveispirillum sp. BGYR6]
MSSTKPYRRCYRPMKGLINHFDDTAQYIVDREYALHAQRYIRGFLIIIDDLKNLFNYIEPSDECLRSYSHRIHEMFMRACVEVEANFKAILRENGYKKNKPNMVDYFLVDHTHHLSSYEVLLPIWDGFGRWVPFEKWRPYRGKQIKRGDFTPLEWYKAYNNSKHDRYQNFKEANFENLIKAVSGLLVLITSQFKDIDVGSSELKVIGGGDGEFSYSIGGIFMVKYPTDWCDDEMYEFDWEKLKKDNHRFLNINFNEVENVVFLPPSTGPTPSKAPMPD